MTMRAYRLAALTGLLLLACGCGGTTPVAEVAVHVAPREQQPLSLTGPVDVNLAELLTKPREALARQCDTVAEKIRFLEETRAGGQTRFLLAPDLRLPLALPIWQAAKYDAAAGFSLPPYLKAGQKDASLARHLARYGDAEAARKVAPDGEAVPASMNYPLEWSRLAALHLHLATLNLARGDAEAARTLVGLHQQLRQTLDAEARAGPLGQALLAPGRSVLERAVTYWTEGKNDDLAGQARAALDAWGDVPAPRLPLAIGSTREETAAVFGGTVEGHAVRAPSPAKVVDLLGLALPARDVTDVVACLDATGRLTEMLLLYGPGVRPDDLTPERWSALFTPGAGAPVGPTAFTRHGYQLADATCDVQWFHGNLAAGAIVRLSGTSPVAPLPLKRDLGLLHLGRTFEANRLRFARDLAGPTLEVSDPAALARLTPVAPGLPVQGVMVSREPAADLVEKVSLRLASPGRDTRLVDLALPLWQRFGRCETVAGSRGRAGGDLSLAWADGQTRYALNAPAGRHQPVTLQLTDHPAETAEERLTGAIAFNAREREERPFTYLPRELENLRPGQARAEVLRTLPAGDKVFPRDVEGGKVLTLAGPVATTAYQPRELVVRFAGDRLAEVRVVYVTAQPKQGGVQSLLAGLTKDLGLPSETAAGKSGKELRYHDDRTRLTVIDGPGSVEVRLRERPAGTADDRAEPLQVLPRGPENLALGTPLADLRKQWAGAAARQVEDALQLTPPAGGPYDQILVWFRDDRVSRVVARHRLAGDTPADPARASQAVLRAWGERLRDYGWPRDQKAEGGVVQSCGNHDDRTAVRLFWQQQPGRIDLFTEWQ